MGELRTFLIDFIADGVCTRTEEVRTLDIYEATERAAKQTQDIFSHYRVNEAPRNDLRTVDLLDEEGRVVATVY